MIMITKLATSILIQRDDTEIVIDDRAITSAMPSIIGALISTGHALALARRESYEAGLNQGYINAEIAHQTSERVADRQAQELVEALVGCELASAA